MAETIRYTLQEPSLLLYSSVTEKSAPKDVANAVPKFSGTFGIGKLDFDAIVAIMVQAITNEVGPFTAPTDYFLACQSGKTAAKRALQSAELKCASPGLSEDAKFKIREKAQARATLYEPYPGILSSSSQYDVELARLDGGKIVDIAAEAHARAQAGKDFFYPGATVVPSVAFKAFRRKSLDAKDGCTSYLQNCLFVRKTPRIAGAGGPANNEVFGNYAGYSAEDPTALAPTADDEPAF